MDGQHQAGLSRLLSGSVASFKSPPGDDHMAHDPWVLAGSDYGRHLMAVVGSGDAAGGGEPAAPSPLCRAACFVPGGDAGHGSLRRRYLGQR